MRGAARSAYAAGFAVDQRRSAAAALTSTFATPSLGANGDLIALEVLQGFRQDRDYKLAKEALDALTIYDLLGGQAAIRCADNYRALRRKGITVKKNADLIIATFCIDNGFPLLFADRDFLPFVEHLGLKPAI